MCPYDKEIEKIKTWIKENYNPQDIYLFGSCAKGLIRKNSDIDLCVIINTENKRQLVQDILIGIDCELDVDIVVYTPEEWERHRDDQSTFAHIIANKGVSIIG